MKTAVDYGFAIAGVIVLLPLFAIIAAAIKLGSPGAIIHRRRVLGRGGIPFDAFKFRTMVTDGQSVLARHPEIQDQLRHGIKPAADPRVTPLGRWLRCLSLDELPQLGNVILGQMSLVGPRLVTPQEAVRYGAERALLLSVKPGLTGPWQVSGRALLDWDERIRMDLAYARSRSLALDLRILFVATPLALLSQRGAY